MMELLRFKTTSLYFIEGTRFFIFWKNNNNSPQLDFSTNFIGQSTNKWILFFHESDINRETLEEGKLNILVDALNTHNAAICWVDDFKSNEFSLANLRRLILDKNIVSLHELEFEQNNSLKDFNFYFENIDDSRLKLTSDNNLSLSRNDGANFYFNINQSKSNFNEAIIGLLNETGCVKFVSNFQDEKSSLNVAIPYYETIDKKFEPIVIANVFDKTHLVGCSLDAKYYPYSKSNNSNFRISHPISGEQIKTNILDFDSNNLHTDEIANIEFSLSKIVHVEDNPLYNRYILSPSGGLIKTTSPHALAGYSGTESVETKDTESLSIKFGKTKFFKVPNETSHTAGLTEDPLLRLEKHNDLSEAGFWTFVNKAKYNIDAQQSPQFSNLKKTQSEPTLETNYSPIKIADVTEVTAFSDELVPPLPIIPTLAFTNNPRLVKLENVFSKIRLRELTKNGTVPVTGLLESDKKYVTPQGFLREGNTIEFVKSNGTFTVENVTLNSDFNLSLSKEDVFFVLEPSMLESKTEKVSVNFKIGNSEFRVELKAFKDLSNEVSKDTYIIFKFSRHSFTDLLNEPNKWSNYNSYKPKDYNTLIDSIKRKIASFDNSDDYKYYNDTISKDPNWNGVVILNIPITDQMPTVFNGLAASQDKVANPNPNNNKPENILQLKTGLKFKYVAFPVNRTKIENGVVDIVSTSFYGIIDYDIVGKDDKRSEDYKEVTNYFTNEKEKLKHKFLLTKLLVRFENSSIKNFQSFAFWQVPNLFDNDVNFEIKDFPLSHTKVNPVGDKRINLIRLEGNYQKNSAGNDEFNFSAQSTLQINFENGNILKNISVSKVGFSYSEGEKMFRFDIDAKTDIKSWALSDLISIKKLDFQNIGFKFSLAGVKLPSLEFDLSKLLVFPDIEFNGKGFLSSFPIKFSHFQGFKIPKLPNGTGLGKPIFDFYSLKFVPPNVDADWLSKKTFAQLFSFIFDFDLGTLGDLGGLKALKGQLLVGWSLKGGFALGFKLAGPSSDGLHLDLFGAVKLDVKEVSYGQFKPKGLTECSAYFLRLNDASVTIFGKQLPGDKNTFNGIIITDFSNAQKKIAWLINYDNQETGDLILGIGQRMGPPLEAVSSTVTAIQKTKETFKYPLKNVNGCNDPQFYNKINFRPERNWLLASEAILPKDWPIELKFIFNDPVLYGIYLGFKGEFLKGFSIDILYKKLSESLGVYSTEIQLPDSLRNQELGGAFLKLPNIGIEIYTNGDWKVDIGFPRNGNDWSRSGFLQLRTAPPFVGFFGFYVMMSKVASLTLFKGYIDDTFSQEKLQIIQAGFAMRVGIGFYFDKGILYVGASITIYGILEGAFAFEKQKGLAQIFPDHFAVLGRMGAIAELVGYVDFRIIKASVYISLRAEFGMLMVYIGNSHTLKANGNGSYLNPGIQPVLVYIEGEVIVRVSIKIGCVKIRLSFRKLIRFEYTIGGGSSSGNSLMGFTPLALPAFTDVVPENEPPIPIEIKGIKDIPMMYLPAFSKVDEGNGLELKLIHSFMIPFFGKKTEKNEKGEVVKIIPSDKNILKNKIIKPFFDELIGQLKTNGILDHNKYETIRSVLITGYAYQNKENQITKEVRKTKVKVDVSISGYVPTFIKGINSGDKFFVDEILKKQFLFNEDNSEHKTDAHDNSIEGKYNDELLLIPAPISGKIKIIESGKPDIITTSKTGFKLKIEGLVSGLPTDGTQIKEIKDYNDATLEFIEKFYDDYKTQFLERKERNALAFDFTDNKDIREAVIIPEFFKLIGLLTLEAFQNDTNPKNKDQGEWNPNILLNDNGDFLVDGKPIDDPWKTNDAIPEIVGQLNYFYNSGLRLPFEDNNYQTKSIYNILQQEVTVEPIATPDLSTIKIDFNGVDLTSDVFRDDPAKNEMLTFINGINKFEVNKLKQKLITKDNDYNPTDYPIQFTKPYRLMPVSLAVQNGKLGIENVFRFFEIPRKLSQHSGGKTKYSFEVNYTKYQEDEIVYSTNKKDTPKLIGIDKCLNVEVKVKKHNKHILEIVNVYADDLNLMNALHCDDFSIAKIDFYYKPDADPKNQEAVISLINLKNIFVTILKTNLSPRTSPPIFKELISGLFEQERKEYWEDSNVDTSNFIRLVWEALTTNNGGYYLILDQEFNNEIAEGSLIISFTSENISDNYLPAYFNSIKISNQEIIKGLDNTEKPKEGEADNRHYLFIDGIKLEGKEIQEYQPTIPAHTVGFDVYRESKEDEGIYHNYLPLEFSLKNEYGDEVLSRDKVLPIMPSSFKDVAGYIVEGKVKYNHLTPLVIQSSSEDAAGNLLDPLGRNLDRYSAVSQKYNLGINLRDVFGNRTNPDDEFLATAPPYTHQYFDKLIPIESWPLVRFSYWFKKADANNIIFDIACTCNILEILDLAGVKKEDITNNYRYQLGDEITDRDDVIKLQAVVPGILNNLYTIYAQLNDSKIVASINGVKADEQKEKWKITVRDLFERLEMLIRNVGGKYKMPEKPVVVPKAYSVEISTTFKLKTALRIEIGLKRLETYLIHNINKDLLESNIWDYNLTKEVKTSVTALNPNGTDKSKLTDLNTAIRGTDKKYCLGISSEISPYKSTETKSDKVIFLINEDKLASLQANVKADQSFADSSYFGIKPISNSLWSGDYKPISYSLAQQSFSNIDLDKSLRVVLEKIDSFLQANTLSSEIYNGTETRLIKETYNSLLKGKMLLVNEKLKDKLAWVINKAELSDRQKLEFRDLLLSNLTNFYAYDGMVKTEFKDIELLKYKVNTDPIDPAKSEERTHRLNVNLKSDKYNLVSSKIGDEKYGKEWYILFDQKDEVIDNINFDVQPEITHIEYDIRDVEGSEDIQQSTWIQLINPITLKEKYSVKNWQKITRKFPDKPVIIKHEASQIYKDGAIEIKNWNEDKIGLWNYKLEIKESNYEPNDIIHVDLEIETATNKSAFAEEAPKFEGFLAYWASEFSMPTDDSKKLDQFKKFVEDLERQFNQTVELMDDANDKNKIVYPFSLKKVKDTIDSNKSVWAIMPQPNGSPLVIKGVDNFPKTPSVLIGPFDIFKNEMRIISVLPKVRVKRNFSEKINNPDFVYETDTVMPESPATPQLQYHLPIRIENSKIMAPIFDKIAGLNLPYKSTAKLLINTADLDNKREEMLPVIPVRQMEFNAGGKPVIKAKYSGGIEKEITIDELFNKYSNGYPSISLTIYNDDNENQPPIFVASNIYKQKQ